MSESTATVADATVHVLQQKLEQLQRTVDVLASRVRLLEEENTSLAGILREHGIGFGASSDIALELPPPREEPLAADAEPLAVLTAKERELLEEIACGDPVYVVCRTDTHLDTGAWLSKGKVCAATTEDSLLLFASGKRSYMENVPFDRLRRSLYNHVTGELVLAPARSTKVQQLKLAPLDAYQVLAQIYQDAEIEDEENADA